ncbi:CAP domain-containing protein [Desarmillaria tabescens]|uniref:CAP domain-containing protein n=1 Tax=Armillaria tabescens TaxID=1929756 RepID=A0AA39NH21_ARMTA|nr:CAP domain-containing protein [Desarmillaria tabescens]KAK0465394.1 CAP domain-containing protein [Desarmillaria tabescens]
MASGLIQSKSNCLFCLDIIDIYLPPYAAKYTVVKANQINEDYISSLFRISSSYLSLSFWLALLLTPHSFLTRMARSVLFFHLTLLFSSFALGRSGPACSMKHRGEQLCVELCKDNWGFPGAVMGSNPWGPVLQTGVSPEDWDSIIAQACGSDAISHLRRHLPNWLPSTTPAFFDTPLTTSTTIDTVVTPSSSLLSSTELVQTSSSVPTFSTTTTSTSETPSTSSSTFSSVIASSLAPSETSSSSSTPSSDIITYLDAHNTIRAQHGATGLTWSDELAGKAQQWANGCVFEHSGGSLGSFGENLAAGTGSGYTINSAIKSWTDEASMILTIQSRLISPRLFGKATNQVGCAVQSCDGIFDASFGKASYYVCEYSPAGNVIGQFAENVQA